MYNNLTKLLPLHRSIFRLILQIFMMPSIQFGPYHCWYIPIQRTKIKDLLLTWIFHDFLKGLASFTLIEQSWPKEELNYLTLQREREIVINTIRICRWRHSFWREQSCDVSRTVQNIFLTSTHTKYDAENMQLSNLPYYLEYKHRTCSRPNKVLVIFYHQNTTVISAYAYIQTLLWNVFQKFVEYDNSNIQIKLSIFIS